VKYETSAVNLGLFTELKKTTIVKVYKNVSQYNV